ncbi:maltose O-acetyltransferase [Lentzea atacamensis]|uniref:Acetyltransferase n=2 Tax=Lentzea atacamensis TaxID=531938 RepID=A0A316I4Z8_9PSEU|nr:sugar O-acetyltransferase [Lentzea atacamensis]PWK87487.1 maltose O-acetyltransferase [Lentzea atacamensis]RAS69816.1 maltose O-acetyltransferase [Lentzea atacamensis]
MISEKQKMMNGQLYKDSDPALVAERRRAQQLVDEFNATRDDAVIKELLGSIGEDSWVMPRFQCDYGYQIHLGSNSFLNYDAILMDCATITIGDDVSIGPRAQLLTALHPIEDHEARRQRFETAAPITIGNNVWLGGGVIVCAGVTIGDNAVIGAGSVVTRDIPPRVLAVGNPCKVIRDL